MATSALFLSTLGGLLLLGLLTTTLAERTFLPRVTLLLIFGALIGTEGFDLIPPGFSQHFNLIAEMTLIMVGFLIGGKLTLEQLRQSATEVFWISAVAAVFTTLLVAGCLWLLGVSPELALLLGCIASATAPAALLDVVEEINNKRASESPFGRLLLSIVAIDDFWALLLFAVGLSAVTALNGGGLDAHFFMEAAREVVIALVLGVAIGLPAAYLTGRACPGQPILIEALGIVFLCGGLAIWLEVSYLITAMTVGATVANLAKHHEYPFHAIEDIEAPFMVIFFILAGSALEFEALQALGLMGLVYLLGRSAGKYLGALIGAQLAGSRPAVKHWMGLALLPQAGVPIGMALVAAAEFPQYRQVLLSVVVSSTVLFDIVGPVLARVAIRRGDSA